MATDNAVNDKPVTDRRVGDEHRWVKFIAPASVPARVLAALDLSSAIE